MGRQRSSQKRFSFLGKAAGREFEPPESMCMYLTEDGNLTSLLGFEGCQVSQWKLVFPYRKRELSVKRLLIIRGKDTV